MPRHQPSTQTDRNTRFFRFGRDPDGHYRFSPDSVPDQFRLIGNGEVGGKARGLMFAMDHMQSGGKLSEHQHLLRFPDSTIITTELFDDFVRENRLEDTILAACTDESALHELTLRIVDCPFPAKWEDPLRELLETETRPLVVRSSSIMEDDSDHSFAGIYLSDFMANRGTPDERLSALILMIKRVYASTFGMNARAYRKRHGLDWRKEKMAVIVQNMIGSLYSHGLFYPLVGGVGFSVNYYPWTDRLSPEDGIVRLVVGTGTRAVGREFARVFSPKLPGLRPEGSDDRAIIRSSQEMVDVLDMNGGGLIQRNLNTLANPLLASICSIVGEEGDLRDPLSTAAMLSSNERFVASFTRLIEGTSLMPFTPLIRETLASLVGVLEHPVDIEFAVDFSGPEASAEGTPLFYILQVRPLGNRPEHRPVSVPKLQQEQVLMHCNKVLGNGYLENVRHLVLVDPSAYRWDKAYEIARAVGRINATLEKLDEPYILMGPGRWASSNPQLGVPAQYNEISGAAVIVEMSTASFSPELSYGTHFYADMVASDVLYLPFDEGAGDVLNRQLLKTLEVVAEDEFVHHYRVSEGMTVYVDGANQRGVIAANNS